MLFLLLQHCYWLQTISEFLKTFKMHVLTSPCSNDYNLIPSLLHLSLRSFFIFISYRIQQRKYNRQLVTIHTQTHTHNLSIFFRFFSSKVFYYFLTIFTIDSIVYAVLRIVLFLLLLFRS